MDSPECNNIKQALIIEYGNNVSNSFLAYVQEEEFDAETIESDIKDDDDVANCSIVTHLSEKLPSLFNTENKKKALLSLLKNALDGNMPVKQKKNFDFNSIKWTLNKNEIKKAQQFITTHCAELIQVREKSDTALLEVIAIGRKNEIPLLNWLTDTYSRYRINNYYLKKEDIQKGNWMREYALFRNLREKGKQKVLDKLNSSIQSFYTRMFNSIQLKSSLVEIDDSINEFVDYLIVMNNVIERLVQENEIAPCQIDMWIIPKNVISGLEEKASATSNAADGDDESESDEEEDDDDNDSDNVGIDMFGNIDYRLKSNKFNFTKQENTSSLKEYPKMIRTLTQKIQSQINGKRNQRIILLVDRRNPKYNNIQKENFKKYVQNGYDNNDDEKLSQTQIRKDRKKEKKTWNDRVYIAQSSKEKYSKLPTEQSPETSFWASTQCMLPIIGEESVRRKNKDWGVRSDFNGFQFTLSWHIDAADQIRCYWFSNCWGTRLFPNDAIKLWPLVFKKNSRVDKERINKLQNCKQVQDDAFYAWYEKTTNQPLIVAQ